MKTHSLSTQHCGEGGWWGGVCESTEHWVVQGVNSVAALSSTFKVNGGKQRWSPVTSIVPDLAATLLTPETPKAFLGLKHPPPLHRHSGE